MIRDQSNRCACGRPTTNPGDIKAIQQEAVEKFIKSFLSNIKERNHVLVTESLSKNFSPDTILQVLQHTSRIALCDTFYDQFDIPEKAHSGHMKSFSSDSKTVVED